MTASTVSRFELLNENRPAGISGIEIAEKELAETARSLGERRILQARDVFPTSNTFFVASLRLPSPCNSCTTRGVVQTRVEIPVDFELRHLAKLGVHLHRICRVAGSQSPGFQHAR
jgi:hypothetical protein